MKSKIEYEMNKAFLKVMGEELESKEDYRTKMLENNEILGLIMPVNRTIDGEKISYYDVTDKESLFNYMIKRIADKEEIENLFRSIYRISKNLKEILIDEDNLLLDPELIFRNMRTGEYEFICVPKREGYEKEDTKKLLQFIMTRIDNTDEVLVETVFDLYNKSETSILKISVIYEQFSLAFKSDEIVCEEEEFEQIEEEKAKKRRKIYIPSWEEIGAYGLCILGIILIGVNLYRSFL